MTADRRLYALVAAVALAASATSLRNGFVYDDVPVVEEDPRIRALSPGLLTMPYWAGDVRDRIYRPLTTASLALDRAAGGGSPFAFHLTNVLLHTVVCLLVFALARRVLDRGPGALVAALWFAVHPVHVEVVAGVVGRSELIAALGYLIAVLAWMAEGEEAARHPSGGRRAGLALLTLAGAAIGVGGKEHAITLPATLLLVDAWTAFRGGQRFGTVFRRHAILWAGVVAVAAGYLALRVAVLGTALGAGNIAAGLENLGIAGRAMVMAPALLVWARLMIWPVHLAADYSPNAFVPEPTLNVAHVAAAVLLVGCGLAAWALRRRTGGVTLGLAWFVITASVAANVAVPTGVLIAERVLYLPSVGIALVAGALWTLAHEALRNREAGRLVWPVTAVALVLLAARTLTRIPVWHDNDRFFTSLVRNAPDSYRSHWAIGGRAFERRDPRLGEREFLRAIQVYPGDAALIKELGEQYLSAGMWQPADRFLTVSWRIDSLRYDAAIQAVLARLKLGRPDSALALAEEALRRFPDVPTLLMGAGDAWLAKGQPLRALTYRRRMAFAFPGSWQYQHIAADGAARAGRCDEARRRADRAVQLAPDTATAPRRLRAMITEGPTCGIQSPS